MHASPCRWPLLLARFCSALGEPRSTTPHEFQQPRWQAEFALETVQGSAQNWLYLRRPETHERSTGGWTCKTMTLRGHERAPLSKSMWATLYHCPWTLYKGAQKSCALSTSLISATTTICTNSLRRKGRPGLRERRGRSRSDASRLVSAQRRHVGRWTPSWT